MCQLTHFVEPREPNDAEVRREEAVQVALEGTLQDGEVFVVFRAGPSVRAKPWTRYCSADEPGLSATNPDLFGRLKQIEQVVERGYGWGPTLGIWAGILATLVLIQTGWLAQVIGAASALTALKSGWFYLAVAIFGGLVVGWVNDLFARRVLRQQLPRLRALAALHDLTEPELYTRILNSGLWSLQQRLDQSPNVWTFAEDDAR